MKTPLSVVIPFYNEEKNIERVLKEIGDALTQTAIPYEFICVNNGSGDQTGAILARLSGTDYIKIVTVDINQGYGWGVIRGLGAASKEWVTIVSGDGQVDPHDILKAYDAMVKTGADIVKPRRTTRDDGLYRRLISFVYNAIMKIVFRLPGWDFNAPPKIIKKEFLQKISLESKNSFLDPELLIKAKDLGAKIVEVQVTYRERTTGEGHTGLKTIFEFIIDIIRWRFSLKSTRLQKEN